MIDEKFILNRITDLQNSGIYADDVVLGLQIAKNIIEGQLPERKWIPVSERLPEEHGWYLVQYSKELLGGLIIEVAGYDERGFLGSLSDVLAWMPLPQPYQEEKDE